MARFVMDKVAYDEMTKSPTGMVGRHLGRIGARLRLLARAQAGVKTGALKASMNYKVTRNSHGLHVLVGSSNKIALMHHQGTRAHIIVPRRAQTLRFYSHGRIVYAQIVHHPGTRPNRYLTDNLHKVI